MNMKENGFTLIELIIVIVLLGILAATALPRFVDFSADAHKEKLKIYTGSFRSAISTAELLWQVKGKTSPLDYSGNGNKELAFDANGKISGASDNSTDAAAGHVFGAGGNLQANNTICANFARAMVPDIDVGAPSSENVCDDVSFTNMFCAIYSPSINGNIGRCNFIYTEDGAGLLVNRHIIYTVADGVHAGVSHTKGDIFLYDKNTSSEWF